MTRAARSVASIVPAVLGGCALLASGGCVAAGFVASPLVSAVQMMSDRSLEKTLPAERGIAWAASVDALQRMGITVERTDRSGDAWVLEGSGETVSVVAKLSSVTPRMTRIAMRVEAGTLVADKQTAEAILDQVAAAIVTSAASPSATTEDATRDLAALKHEMQELRSTLERSRSGVAAPVSPTSAASRTPSEGTPVYVVPASYGFLSAPASVRGAAPVTTPLVPAPGIQDDKSGSRIDDIVVSPMTTVGTLVPVEGLRPKSRER